MLSVPEILKQEFEFEVATLRKMMERVPFDKADWKPHTKSMSLKALTTHLAELPAWVTMGLNTTELDFAKKPYIPTPVSSTDDLLVLLSDSYKSGKASLEKVKDADLLPQWTLRHGQHVLATMNKYEVIRHALNQIAHHRGQLSVYLRLLDVPVPGSYGPSADDMAERAKAAH